MPSNMCPVLMPSARAPEAIRGVTTPLRVPASHSPSTAELPARNDPVLEMFVHRSIYSYGWRAFCPCRPSFTRRESGRKSGTRSPPIYSTDSTVVWELYDSPSPPSRRTCRDHPDRVRSWSGCGGGGGTYNFLPSRIDSPPCRRRRRLQALTRTIGSFRRLLGPPSRPVVQRPTASIRVKFGARHWCPCRSGRTRALPCYLRWPPSLRLQLSGPRPSIGVPGPVRRDATHCVKSSSRSDRISRTARAFRAAASSTSMANSSPTPRSRTRSLFSSSWRD